MTWTIFDENDDKWHKKFLEMGTHYRQSYGWGNYKSLMGWKVLRLKKITEDRKSIFVQLTYKKFLFFSAIYIPGNIIGDVKYLDQEFKKSLRLLTKSYFIYVRMDTNSSNIEIDNEYLTKNKWYKPIHREHVSRSISLNIDKSDDQIIKGASDNWKKSYKKSLKFYTSKKFYIKFSSQPNSSDLVRVSNEMNRSKKIFSDHIEKEFDNLYKTLPNNILFGLIYDQNNNPISYRAFIYFNNKGWDLGAATSPEGRDLLASYFLTIELLKKARDLGVGIYNFGGIDKKNKPGVYFFKKGIANYEYDYSGEWEWSNIFLLRYFMNFLISIIMSNSLRKIFPMIKKLRF